jgi:type IV pilus assembly protein PilY1
MNHAIRAIRIATLPLMLGSTGAALAAPPFTLSPYPLFLASSVKPNLMVIFDNSQSMDATMGGKVISGNDPNTRANIARGVLRGVIGGYRSSFNWGLTTFETRSDSLYNTQAYYLGNAGTMVYTNDCVNGISASTSGLRCIPNPQPTNGYSHITYERSGDDADINDVYYTNDPLMQYGVGQSGTTFTLWASKSIGTGWSGFSGASQTITFTPTDAGFTPNGTDFKRALFQNRGWGYFGEITGRGKIVEAVQADSDGHFNRLQSSLGNETNLSTSEIKNSALFTPLAGSLRTVRDYFGQGISSTQKSPVSEICQANYVVLATDGNPTGRTDGTQYSPSQWVNSFDPASNSWTWGQAQNDVFAQITALRSTALSGANLSAPALAGQNVDVRTYVIGMGDTVANASSVAALNRMAQLGGAHPTAFLGSSSAALSNAFQTIVGNIQARVGAGAAVALNTGSWRTGSAAYQARFNSTDWSGDLLAYPVSADGTTGGTPNWSAAARLALQDWNTQRNILTYKPSGALGGRGIRFRWPVNAATPTAAELDVSQTNALNQDAAGNTDGFGAQRLAYLRGDTSRERRRCLAQPCAVPQFRDRPSTVLGDFVNSAPYYVAAPAFGYFDDFEGQPYSSFVSTYRNRTPMIYVGGNDGMLHAFNASNGNEVFAYVPAALYSTLTHLSNPNYGHRYYADGSPTVGDVFYGGAWRTLLVAGMRGGAKGVYALDVTDPANFSESTANSVVRWEFQDPDLGYVFGQPLLVKTNNGRWSVIVSGGYNAGNASGRAMLFLLDAETGALVRKIDTGAGTAASPNGLSGPAAIDGNGDGIVDAVYAGDLNGNLWSFDLQSATPASWIVGNGTLPLFTTPNGQPITGRPDVTRFPRGGVLVGFGTGRYLAASDHTSTDAQSVYAIWDNGANVTVTLAQLQQQTIAATATRNGVEFRLSTHAVGPAGDAGLTGDNVISRTNYYATRKGWYVNLPTSGERVVSDAAFRAGRLIFASMIPDASSPCAYGGTGWLLEFDAFTGNRLDSATFDTNGDKTVTSADFIVFTTVNATGASNVSGRRLGAISAAPGFMRSGDIDLRLLNKADGSVDTVIASPGAARPGRAMWREVQ